MNPELYRAKRLLTWVLERLDPNNEDDMELAAEIRDFLGTEEPMTAETTTCRVCGEPLLECCTLKPIPPMPQRDGSILTSYADRLENWGIDLASRLEAAQAVVEALNPGEEDPLTVARRLKRERVELGTAINRLAQALGWPSITPDRPFAEQTVDVALERLALADKGGTC